VAVVACLQQPRQALAARPLGRCWSVLALCTAQLTEWYALPPPPPPGAVFMNEYGADNLDNKCGAARRGARGAAKRLPPPQRARAHHWHRGGDRGSECNMEARWEHVTISRCAGIMGRGRVWTAGWGGGGGSG